MLKLCFYDKQFVNSKTSIILQTIVNRSPSATVIYRHHTPPKEPQQPQYHGNNGGPAGGNDESGFVVHRSKGITTLSTMHDPLVPARTRQAKEKNNNDSKQEERGRTFVSIISFLNFSFSFFAFL